jgi:ubiquinone/menaquinone biosynthesis C-methylase UbiE
MEEEKLIRLASQLRKPEGVEGIKTGESMNQGNKFMNLDTLRIVNPASGDSILEIGMGNGLFVKDLLEKAPSIRYVGFDYSPVMVNEAKRINDEWIKKGNAEFFLGEVSSLPFPAKSFNKIFTINTIYFWKNNEVVLRELKRVLKPGGTLIISIRPRRQMENYPFTKYGFNMYSSGELKELLMENGFGIKNSHEIQEPDYEFNGSLFKMESLIVESYALT